jgi:protein-tyrosine phosphatase
LRPLRSFQEQEKLMIYQFTDYHCHLLPAIDDGATDPEESVAMAKILSSFGYGRVYCTPHRIKGCFENDPARVREATASMQQLLDREGVPLRLFPGTEHYLDEFLIDQLDDAAAIESRYLLVEAPFRSGDELIHPMVAGVKQKGLVPLFAHPERCRAFDPVLRNTGRRGPFSFLSRTPNEPAMDPLSLVLSLREAGCRFQGNLGSFSGWYGNEIREKALLFLRHGVYSCLGSDAHRSEELQTRLAAGYRAVSAEVGEEGARRLMAGADL